MATNLSKHFFAMTKNLTCANDDRSGPSELHDEDFEWKVRVFILYSDLHKQILKSFWEFKNGKNNPGKSLLRLMFIEYRIVYKQITYN